jgi:hypothetical protein
MRSRPSINALVREMQRKGFDDHQALRFDLAFDAAKAAAVTLLCARHGVPKDEMLEAVCISPRLAADARDLVARMEISPAFVRHIHSGQPF